MFAQRQVEVLGARILGKNRNVLKLRLEDSDGTELDALYFGNPEEFLDYAEEAYGNGVSKVLLAGKARGIRMAFTFYPEIHEYRGNRSIQIIVQDYK